MTILILGGTGEARELATLLTAAGEDVLTSLAGRVSRPAVPPGRVRVGGFGGAVGLASFVNDRQIAAVVDATHPFAERISEHAAQAAAAAGVPLLRLVRPGWSGHPDAGRWTWVSDSATARAAAEWARHPFLTTGRQSLADFLAWADRPVLARVVDPPPFDLPPGWTLIRSRGPYEVAAERRLMLDHRVDVVITKDSGGRQTEAKLTAAGALGIVVVVIARPDPPGMIADQVETPAEAVSWLQTVNHQASDASQARCSEA
jgi:precorrin-6A/cobalt-precorrin-6A reductase